MSKERAVTEGTWYLETEGEGLIALSSKIGDSRVLLSLKVAAV